MNKIEIINSLALLAKAYAFAKNGDEETAGRLLVQAAEDGNLDEVMDGVAQGAEALEEEDEFEDLPEEDESIDDAEDIGEDYSEDDDSMELNAGATKSVTVELPESVARLAARTLI